jgi:hypothetical protein
MAGHEDSRRYMIDRARTRWKAPNFVWSVKFLLQLNFVLTKVGRTTHARMDAVVVATEDPSKRSGVIYTLGRHQDIRACEHTLPQTRGDVHRYALRSG